MTEQETTDELLKQVLAEVKAINERNKKAASEEERGIKNLKSVIETLSFFFVVSL